MKRPTRFVLGLAILLAVNSLHADIREGLVAYWPLNTGTGAYPMTTPDVVGGNDMTGPFSDADYAFVPGRFGNAMTFEGAFTYLSFQAPTGSDTGLPVSKKGSWTMSLWVNGTAQPGGNYYFDESSSASLTPLTAFTARANTNSTAIYVRDASGNNPVNLPTVTNATLDGTWHHVAMTYDAATRAFRHYVDGNLVYTNAFTPNYNNNALYDLVNVGARLRNGAIDLYFTGSVDDVALWARALSQAEIQGVIADGIGTPVPQFAPVVTVNPTGANNLLPGDSYRLSAFSYGSRPLSYQWLKDGTNYPGATTDILQLSNVTTNDTGAYRLVIANALGAATTTVAQITVNAYGSPDLTNGLVAYWPLDSVVGVKTPDLVSAYDMTLNNMSGANVVSGRWGNALYFSNPTTTNAQFGRYLRNPGDALPAYLLTNFTVSVWVKGTWIRGCWFFAEASTLSTQPAFCLGQRSSSSDRCNTFIRTDGGTQVNDNRSSTTPIWDNNWHNVVWVQHDAGGTPKAQLYIDGNLDGVTLIPAYGVTPNNTALASFARATPGQFFDGAIDEVAIWSRPLSKDEISLLQSGYITNPPTRLTPLAVNTFKSDLPAVARGDSTVLRWDVPANATQVLIDPLGDVTARTVSGVGSTNVTLTNATTFVLTVKRGGEQVKATNAIGVVSGVAGNWSLLDNFDFYSPGALAASGWWIDIGGGSSVSVVTPAGCNRMVKTLLNPSGAYLPLKSLAVGANQSCTLFFRMIPTGSPGSTLRQYLGLTDRPGNFPYQYTGGNIGPAVQPTVNDPFQNPGDWLLAARNYPASPLTFAPTPLQAGAVYSVWIDVTNVFLGDRAIENMDLFSVHIQKEGEPERTTLFENFVSDRDLMLDDPLTGGLATDNLNRIYLCGNSATDSALFDDFYLSKSGYNATVPRPYGYTGPAPTLQLQKAGSAWQIIFAGRLLEASTLTGAWTEVTGATSPYSLPASGAGKFYRAVCD